MFRHPADRIPVAIVAALTLLDFSVYLLVDSVWVLAGYWLLFLVPKGAISAWNHHHQHTRTFHGTWANRLLEQAYALHTGATTNLWLLHHVFGHHKHYLDQTVDESRWTRDDGTQMGMLEYTLTIAITSFYRGYKVGARHPAQRRTFVIYTGITVLLVAALIGYRPVPALFLFVLPMVVSLLFTAWATYDHHAGLTTDDPFEASYNILNSSYNLWTCNLGYHTAHHLRPAAHWSELPAVHAEITGQIPPQCYKRSSFDLFLRGADPAA
jgi:fatty acid desaturase